MTRRSRFIIYDDDNLFNNNTKDEDVEMEDEFNENDSTIKIDYNDLRVISLDNIDVKYLINDGIVIDCLYWPNWILKKDMFERYYYIIRKELPGIDRKSFIYHLGNTTKVLGVWGDNNVFFNNENSGKPLKVKGINRVLLGFMLYKFLDDFIDIPLMVVDQNIKEETMINGIGTYMINYLKRFNMDIYTFPDPKAEGFYKKKGFKETKNDKVRFQMSQSVVLEENEFFGGNENELEYIVHEIPLFCCKQKKA